MSESTTTATPAFGLVAWLEQTRVSLPLKGVECRFDVTGGVVSVEVDQIFHQDNTRPLDCTYTFPLPAGAAVHRCEMHINGRVIRAKVEEREAARRIYEEQKAAGRRASLVETERENLFTLSLGNVQPGDLVVIRFAWFQKLERIAGGSLSVRVPVCPGIRYIAGHPLLRAPMGRGTEDDTDEVPDASRLSPPRIDALHPDAAYFAATGTIARDDAAAGSIVSPSHALIVRDEAARFAVALSDGGIVPDRDLIVRWSEPRATTLAPRAWRSTFGGRTYALAQLRGPESPPSSADAVAAEQDVYFLVDRSGSMQGVKWTKTCEALSAFVALLGGRDRVWITLFESGFRDFAEKPLLASVLREDRNFKKLVELGADGGTELRPAAEHVLEVIARESRERRARVVLITDGQVGNESAIVAAFRAHRGVSVFTFGIDTAVNDAFLRDLARQTGGECWLQSPHDDIVSTVAKLGSRLRHPVLTDLRIVGAWNSPVGTLPDLHAGQVVDVSLCAIGEAPAKLSLIGRRADGAEQRFDLDLTPTQNAAVHLLWAREQITARLDAGDRAAGLLLAKEHNLICEGAAFVAWDEAEHVAVATESVYQPSMETPMQAMAMAPASYGAGGARSMVAGALDSMADMLAPSPRRSRKPAPSTLAKVLHAEENAAAPVPEWKAKLLAAGVDATLVAVLEEWLAHSLFGKAGRRKKLETFAQILTARALRGAELVRACREFVETHVQRPEPLRVRALACLDTWDVRV